MDKMLITLLFFGHIWVDASQGVIPVVNGKLQELFSISYSQAGLLVMILNLTSSFIQPIFGMISDRFNLGWVIPVGVLWTSVAMGLVGHSPNYWVAFILVGLSGIGTAAFHPRAMMAVFQSSGDRRGLGSSIFSTGGNLGFALGPFLGQVLILGLGFGHTVWLMVPAAIIFVLIYAYGRDGIKQVPQKPAAPRTSQTPGVLPGIPWVPVGAIFMIIALRSWVYMSMIAFMPMLFKSRGYALGTGSHLLTFFLLGGAIAGLYGGHLSDRVGRRLIIAISMLSYPVLAALFLLTTGPVMWIMALLSGASLLFSFGVTAVVVQELMPHRLGLASGISLGMSFGLGGIGSFLTGVLADHIGLVQTAWILAFPPALAALLLLLVRNPHAEESRQSALA